MSLLGRDSEKVMRITAGVKIRPYKNRQCDAAPSGFYYAAHAVSEFAGEAWLNAPKQCISNQELQKN